ncbi:hypothetical protein [Vibrio parahaemolyticus]|uniref:hypothetical protein n=1 Tax=Vibrio parahaemolyticus TaxID=670 RepID=UPI00387AAC9F|nr:hypothetical protein [Vibrio vulnificus]HCG7304238.1 hypothetical protein [Vibrio parahaemolyticus]
MIKNWTVKTKQIKKKEKGLLNHFNYLFNKKRAAHFYSEISDLNNSTDKLNNIFNEIEARKEFRRENGLRGGGVSNLASSFVLSLPRDIKQPTKKEWKKIAAISLKELSKDLDIPFDKIKNNSVVVLHDESNSPSKSSHVHILVSNVIDGKVEKGISQYKGTYAMKKGVNKAVKQVLGVDNKHYAPKDENVGDKPLYAAREDNLNNKEEKLIESFNNKKAELKADKQEIKDLKSAFEKSVNFAKKIMKNWIMSVRNNQKNELEKRAKQSAKVIVDMEEHLPEVAEELTNVARFEEEQAELLQELRQETKVTHQVEVAQEKKEKKKRKRRTRTRTN